jgi:hypothetical protein
MAFMVLPPHAVIAPSVSEAVGCAIPVNTEAAANILATLLRPRSCHNGRYNLLSEIKAAGVAARTALDVRLVSYATPSRAITEMAEAFK